MELSSAHALPPFPPRVTSQVLNHMTTTGPRVVLDPRTMSAASIILLGLSRSTLPVPHPSLMAPPGPAMGFSVLTGPELAVSPLDTAFTSCQLATPSSILLSLESPSSDVWKTAEPGQEFGLMISETEGHLAQLFLWFEILPGCHSPRLIVQEVL